MTVISGKDANRWKERRGWLIAGAVAAAILMGTASQVGSSALQIALAAGALASVVIAVWGFNRGALTSGTKGPDSGRSPLG